MRRFQRDDGDETSFIRIAVMAIGAALVCISLDMGLQTYMIAIQNTPRSESISNPQTESASTYSPPDFVEASTVSSMIVPTTTVIEKGLNLITSDMTKPHDPWAAWASPPDLPIALETPKAKIRPAIPPSPVVLQKKETSQVRPTQITGTSSWSWSNYTRNAAEIWPECSSLPDCLRFTPGNQCSKWKQISNYPVVCFSPSLYSHSSYP